VQVVEARPQDRPVVESFLGDHDSLRVARRGELVTPTDHTALLAWDGDELAGVATYVVDGRACEVLTLHARTRFGGAGTALLAALADTARRSGCTRLWLVTTNDNVDALRFYQRRGFRLVRLRPGAVDESRAIKPEIPPVGDHGIALRDELELELDR
jgi:ribosomal protein S18 acetylase RimI-like enzyme